MSDATDKASALVELQRLSQYESEPALIVGELNAILDANKRASRWTALADLTLGAVVIPNTRNGHVYEVTDEGSTGASEPTDWPETEGATVTSGTVELTESGKDFLNVYDITSSARDAWALKAAKASELHQKGEEKIFDHCEKVGERFNVPLIA